MAVLDLGLPDGNGADLIRDVREFNAGAAVLVLSASLHPTKLERATEAGADEILDKLATPGEIVGTIRRLGTGEKPTPFDTTPDTTDRATPRNSGQLLARKSL